MNKLRVITKKGNSHIIGKKIRFYIDLSILICCFIIAFNIQAPNITNTATESKRIIYIFHDYKGNEYILNDTTHGAADSLDYLFNTEVPESIKENTGLHNSSYTDSVSLSNNGKSNGQYKESDESNGDAKNNQVSIDNIMSDLGINSIPEDNNYLIIDLSNEKDKIDDNDDTSYIINEEDDGTRLIIEKENTSNEKDENNEKNNISNNDDLLIAKSFSYTTDGWIIPILIPWEDLQIKEYNDSSINSYKYTGNGYAIQKTSKNSSDGVTIIDDYADCMTPRGYKIVHGDSVLAYKQLDNAPDICNIERRYCRNGKLSGTYTQQGCSVNNNYTYNSRGEPETPIVQEEIKGGARQNPDGTVTVKNDEVGGGFVFERPNRTSTEYSYNDNNTRNENEGIEQSSRPYRNCTAPRGEKVAHGQYIQAFKHSNGFSDAPCEIQLRLCTMGELLGTYTESTCKTRDTSFIDWINGSPTRKTYSKEKLELIKKQIKDEEKNYKNTRKNTTKSINSVTLDKILGILDE